MTETASRGSFNHDQTKQVQNGWQVVCGEEASAQNNQNWGYHEANCLVAIWADEEIQRQLSPIAELVEMEYLVPKKAKMPSPG